MVGPVSLPRFIPQWDRPFVGMRGSTVLNARPTVATTTDVRVAADVSVLKNRTAETGRGSPHLEPWGFNRVSERAAATSMQLSRAECLALALVHRHSSLSRRASISPQDPSGSVAHEA